MEKLFTIQLLTIISVLEIILLLKTELLTAQLLIIAVSLFVIFFMLFNMDKEGFWTLSLVLLLLHLFNVGYLYFLVGRDFFLYLIALLDIIGLGLYVTGTRKNKVLADARVMRPKSHELDKEVSDLAKKTPSVVEYPEKMYVASESGKVYHRTTCGWCGNIKEENKIWFETKSDARRAGYKPHSCVPQTRNFVASENSKYYHKPSCRFAKTIQKDNRIWFESRKHAEKKGFKPHDC